MSPQVKRGGRPFLAAHRQSAFNQLSMFWIFPYKPCCSSSIPAAKNSEPSSPPLPPLPKRNPHKPSIAIGALVSLFNCPRNLPSSVNPLIRPSPKFPTRTLL